MSNELVRTFGTFIDTVTWRKIIISGLQKSLMIVEELFHLIWYLISIMHEVLHFITCNKFCVHCFCSHDMLSTK